ncbi:MAG TPA: DUF998 domain-containing protein [Candidatus Aminicenantes bacterium]|nr:DUF998 domain-containing protein [Candidatus Aminicenantes bacterium]
MNKQNGNQESLVFSYLELRKILGILGTSLPFILFIGAWIIFNTGLQRSISYYYHTDMGDVLVGMLFAIGFFLLSYRGYERKDDLAGDLGFVFALGVALFPTTAEGATGFPIIGYIHNAFTVLFFLTLVYFSYFLFTKTDPEKSPTKRKLQRNKVYRTCGIIMFVCVLLIALYVLFANMLEELFKPYKPIFWLEAIAILAFGISWLIKGETLLKDKV